jgi:hypothetical protein
MPPPLSLSSPHGFTAGRSPLWMCGRASPTGARRSANSLASIETPALEMQYSARSSSASSAFIEVIVTIERGGQPPIAWNASCPTARVPAMEVEVPAAPERGVARALARQGDPDEVSQRDVAYSVRLLRQRARTSCVAGTGCVKCSSGSQEDGIEGMGPKGRSTGS